MVRTGAADLLGRRGEITGDRIAIIHMIGAMKNSRIASIQHSQDCALQVKEHRHARLNVLT
jgi:hypothetical protein